ncbi:MAG: 4-(cytidine 5'-diphospho)-2-C-methyl-D-erythritol kinase [Clostridiales bacterium]|nr:4-(cytidine 5'-diphospho)-2-C-methyl-D-erythritol kinase [Clostridiales bacterium]
MGQIELRAYAKVNLSIDVLRRRPDGYHEVSMILQQIDLWDRVIVSSEPGSGKTTLTTNLPWVPKDQKNIAWKAVDLMREKFRPADDPDVLVHLGKRIPVAAGLAGGSSNCAAVLRALNHLWGLGLSVQELMDLGVKLGADVAFCIMAQEAVVSTCPGTDPRTVSTCALAEGIGEKLTPLPPMRSWILLSKPPISVSTAKVYQSLVLDEVKVRPDTEGLITALEEEDWRKVLPCMANVLELPAIKSNPRISEIKELMTGEGALEKAMMSGSGPTVFRIFGSKEEGEALREKMQAVNKETFLIRTSLGGY